jgi:hypothetical protein
MRTVGASVGSRPAMPVAISALLFPAVFENLSRFGGMIFEYLKKF